MCSRRVGTGSQLVYLSIGTLSDWANTPLRQVRVMALLRRAAAVVALWPGAAQAISSRFRMPPRRVWTIPTAVDSTSFTPADQAARRQARRALGLRPDLPTLLSIGALSPEKNTQVAVRLMSRARDHQLLVVGDGPERPRLEALARGTAPERIRFVGSLAQPATAYQAADLVVLASITEGMPAVLIEAAFCGLPAVASAVGGVPNVVIDGETGRLVSVEADLDQWAEVVNEALERSPELGAAARDHALSTFEVNVVAERWCRLHDAIAARHTA